MPQLPGVCAPMIEMMRRGDGEAEQRLAVEHRHAEGDVGAVRGAAVGIVVDDDVARPEHVAARGEALP